MNQNYNYSEIPTGTIPTGYIPVGRIPVGKIPVGTIPGSNPYSAKLIAQEKQDRLNHHLKGISDIILGNPFTGTKQLRVTLEDNGLGWLKDIPLINMTAGFVIFTKERFVDPFINGQPGVAVLNTLESIGTDLDILGNIVKSFMPAAGGGTWDDVLASVGWLDDEYRKYYQYDTGNFLIDFALELVSDPLNYIDFGLGEVAGDSMTKLATKYGDDVIRGFKNGDEVIQGISKNLIEDAIKGNSDAYAKLVKQIENNIKVRKSTLQTLINETQDASTIKKLTKQLKQLDKMTVGNNKALTQIIADARLSKGYKAYKYISKPITDISRYGNLGYSGSVLLWNKAIKPTGKALYNNLLKRLDNVKFTNTVLGTTQQLNTIKKVTAAKTISSYKSEKQKAIDFINETVFGELANRVKLNEGAIDRLWIENLNRLTFKQRNNPKIVAETFRNYLLTTSNFSRWFKVVNIMGEEVTDSTVIDYVLNYIEKNNKTVQQGLANVKKLPTILDPLLDVIEKQELEIYALDVVADVTAAQTQIGMFIEQAAQRYNTDTSLMPPAVQQLKYFVENILQDELTISNFNQRLTYLKRTDNNKYIYFINIANYLGINKDNAALINNLLTAYDTSIAEYFDKHRVLSDLLNTAKENLDDVAVARITKSLDDLDDTYVKQIKNIISKLQEFATSARTGEFINTSKQVKKYKAITDNLIKKLNATFEQDGVQALTKTFESSIQTIDINTDTYEDILKKLKDADLKARDLRHLKKTERDVLNKLKDKLNTLVETYNSSKVNEKLNALNKAVDELPLNEKTKPLHDVINSVLNNPYANLEDLEIALKAIPVTGSTKQMGKARAAVINYMNRLDFYKTLRQFIIDSLNDPKINFAANVDPDDLIAFNNLLNKIIDKNVTVQDILAIDDFYSLLFNLRNVRSSLNKLYKDRKDSSAFITSFVKDFINIFEEHILDTDEYLAQFDALIQNNAFKTVYTIQLSKYTTTMYLLNHVQVNDLWVALSDTTSKTRKLFQSLTEILTDAELKHESAEFKEILSVIDTSNNLLKNILNADEALPRRLKPQHQKDLTTLIFNTIFDRNTDAVNSIIDSNASIKNNLEAIRNKIESSLEDLHFFKEYDYDLNFQEQVMASVDNIVTNYLNEQAHLAAVYDRPLPLLRLPDEIFVKKCTDLGTRLKEIIETLNDNSVDLNNINNTVEVVTSLAGNKVQISETDLIKIVNHEDAKVILDLIKNHPEEESIARAITNAFKEIGTINDQLQGSMPVQSWLHNLDGTRKQLECVTRFIYKKDANDAIADILLKTGYEPKHANAYYYNALSRDISFVKINVRTPMQMPKMHPNVNVLDANNIRKHLAFKYQQIIRMAFLPTEYNTEATRQGLIKFFNHEQISWAPTNIEEYFSKLSTVEIQAWKSVLLYDGVLTRPQIRNFKNCYINSEIILDNRIKFKLDKNDPAFQPYHDIIDRLDFYKDPDSVYTELSEIVETNLFNESNVYDAHTSNVIKDTFNIQTELYKQDFMRYVKDPETLGTFRNAFSHYINNDIDALNNLKALNNLLPSFDHRLKPNGRKFKAAVEKYIQQIKPAREAKRTRQLDSLRSFISFTPAQKRTYIDKYTDGILLIVMPKELRTIGKLRKDLDTVGLKFFDIHLKLDDDNYLYIIRRVDNNPFNTVSLPFLVSNSEDNKQINKVINKVLESNRSYIPLSQQDIPVDLITGEVMNADVWDAILNNKRLQDALGDSSIQKTYRKFGENGVDNIYKLSDAYLQTAILGENGYNKLLDYLQKDLTKMKVNPRKKASDLVNSVFSGSVQMIKRTNNRNKYEQLFFNDDFSFSSSHVQAIFKDATDEEIKNIFKQGNYDAVVLKETKVGRHKAFKITVENRKDLEFAIQQNAILVPHDVYRNIVLTVNKNVDTPALLKFYNQTVTGTFKQIYMTSVGTLFRNAVDTLITKNAQATGGGLLDIIENFKYEWRAAKDIQWYDEINAQITKVANGAFPNRKNVITVLDKLSAKDQLRYKIMDLFEKSGAVDGLSTTLDSYMTKLNIGRRGEDWADYINRIWSNNLNKVPSINIIRNTNELIEKTGRLGLLYRLMDAEGFDFSEAIAKVFETHFDYQVKGPIHEVLEKIFWFSTFPMNNFMFYLNNGFEDNTQLLRAQLALMRLSWNRPESDWEDVKNSDYLRRNALSGNLRIKIGDKTVILKLGLSVFDFFKLLMNPFEEVKERLNPFLAVLFGERDIKDLNPLSTLNSRASTVKQRLEGDQQKSLFPSLYAIAYPRRTYNRTTRSKAYYSYARSSSHWRPKYKKIYFHPSTRAFNAYKKVYQRYNRSKYYVNTDIANIRPAMINSRRYNRHYAKVRHYYRHSIDHVH